jgi:hypothetical protein
MNRVARNRVHMTRAGGADRGGATVPVVLLFLGVLLGGEDLAAQSLLAGAGLGIPAEPLDARARAIGGSGIGQAGGHLLATDPAAAAEVIIPTIAVSYQPTRAELSNGRTAGHARFPMVAVSYPLWGNVFSVGFASVLDQRWEVVAVRTVDLNGIEVDAVDTYRSSGTLSRVHVGWARRIGASIGVGANVGTYLGSLARSFSRLLDTETAGQGVEAFAAQGRWRASGVVLGAGATWDLSSVVRVAAAITWTDKLELSPSIDATPEARDYSLPLEIRAGAAASLTPELALSASIAYADWSTVGEELGAGTTRSGALSYGGGIEWAGASLFGRAFPLRVGARHQDLPFHLEGSPADEQTLSGGFGLELVEAEGQPIARIDFGIERGTRSSGALSESFFRTTLSLRLAGG